MTETQQVGIRFGALAPLIAEQLREQGMTADSDVIEVWHRLADDITGLYLHDMLTETEALRARKRLLRWICLEARREPPQ